MHHHIPKVFRERAACPWTDVRCLHLGQSGWVWGWFRYCGTGLTLETSRCGNLHNFLSHIFRMVSTVWSVSTWVFSGALKGVCVCVARTEELFDASGCVRVKAGRKISVQICWADRISVRSLRATRTVRGSWVCEAC
jgi:hypothetical protein